MFGRCLYNQINKTPITNRVAINCLTTTLSHKRNMSNFLSGWCNRWNLSPLRLGRLYYEYEVRPLVWKRSPMGQTGGTLLSGTVLKRLIVIIM